MGGAAAAAGSNAGTSSMESPGTGIAGGAIILFGEVTGAGVGCARVFLE